MYEIYPLHTYIDHNLHGKTCQIPRPQYYISYGIAYSVQWSFMVKI